MTRIPIAPVVSALREAGLVVEVTGGLPEFVSEITDDSRGSGTGALFVAVRGAERDGHEFLAEASARGAVAAIVETTGPNLLPAILVRDGRRAAAIAAAVAYGHPVRQLRLIGVTGTNGKTTTVGILRHLLDDAAGRSASTGTLGVLIGSEGKGVEGGGGLTTPGPVELQRVLRLLVDAGVVTVAMEVSSHSLDQRRVEGVSFNAAVFTNLTRDHLDYHGTMEEYRAAKAKLLDHLAPNGVAVINRDDPAWETLRAPRAAVSFAVARPDADVHALDVRYGPRGSEWRLRMGTEARDVKLPLIGSFNVANALGAAATAWVLGVPVDQITARLENIPQVPGRLEMLSDRPTVLRDYAHTPDALERALDAVRPFTRRRLIAVFGCGGDRDRGKRPVMGRIASERADVVIVTSDNPRTEDPERILDDIVGGMPRGTHERIEDRREAIARALSIASEDDLIVLAGKGHETYQIKGTAKHPFDEREIVHELLAARRDSPEINMTSSTDASTTESPPAASFWTLDRVADALETVLVSRGPAGNAFLKTVCTDTRSIARGDIFVALAGPTFNAHDFLARAVEGGAGALVVSRPPPIGTVGVPVFHVLDTLRALGALAKYRRAAWGRSVVCVAGSNGKTTTKDLIRAALGSVLTVHATAGNLNNLVGVPLTLLAIPDYADIAVIEIGTSAQGEVARMRDIALPDLAVVTSVGEEHLEGLGEMEEVLREETSVYAGATVGIAPSGQPEVVAAARALARRVVTAGLETGDLGVASSEVGPDGLGSLTVDGVVVRPPVRGVHNLRNAALALAVARECGVAMADAARGIAAMPVPLMRMTWDAIGSATLINDAYNANPPSMRAAIDLLGGAGNGRQRVAVLGTMREMGAHADRVHTDLAKYALASKADVIAAVGDMALALEREGTTDSRVVTAPDIADLWVALQPRLARDAVILLKASRGVRLERLIPMLTEWAR